ncbi:MAG TPA: hypothetical protein P5191_01220 [Ruminococcus sp.]|nr:hypothetical protein [Ruminococcus sp.]
MDITLVTASFNDEVHGTCDEKKTGCGINLLRPENVTKYRRGNTMTDLKEITCDKCKEKLAKLIIKADKKEMSRILKEEKARAKRGLDEEGIVPLGNTTAKITKTPEEKRREEERAQAEARRKAEEEARTVREAAEAAKAAAEEEARKAAEEAERLANLQTIPGTGVPMDNDLAAFAINVPKDEAQQEDDFLAQFAVQKSEETVDAQAASAPVQDDFLAQFAIQAPGQQAQEQQYAPQQPAYAEPEEMADIDLSQKNIQTEEDIMKMFAINQPQQEAAQDYNSYEQPSVVDVEESELSSVQNPYMAAHNPFAQAPYSPQEAPVYESQPSYEHQPVYNAPNNYAPQPGYEVPPVYAQDQPDPGHTEQWNNVANQLFTGNGQYASPETEVLSTPNYGETEVLSTPNYGETEVLSTPNYGETEVLSTPNYGETEVLSAPAAYSNDEYDEEETTVLSTYEAFGIEAEPVSNSFPAPSMPAEMDELPLPGSADASAPVIGDITPPVLDDIAPSAAPLLDDIAQAAEETAPVIEDAAPVVQEEYISPAIEDISQAAAQPAFEELAPIAPQSIEPVGSAPVEPVISEPAYTAAPVENNEVIMDNTIPNQAAPVNTAAARPAAAPAQPQIINVPQFAGYDQKGQPVYTYIQMQMTGIDQNGQPIFAPIQGQKLPTPPMAAAAPKPAAPVQPQAAPAPAVRPAAPVQPQAAPMQTQAAPVQQTAGVQRSAPQHTYVPRKPKAPDPNAPYQTPTANISKIAVNPHSVSTSQSFINAIASSKDYADKNLIETQGLKANSPILTSVEDVLSKMGDSSVKEANARKAAQSAQNVSGFSEYKGPTNSRPVSRPSSAMPSAPAEKDIRFMTKTELKAKKKQDKIDAKFKKDMAKRGF